MPNNSPTMMAQMMVSVTTVFTVAGVVIFILMIIQGVLAMRLASQKGYKSAVKYFLLGFFLGLIGLVYVAGKPVAPKKVAQQQKHLAEAVVDALQ